MIPPAAEANLPPASTIRESAQEVIARSHYELDLAARRDVTPFLQRLIEWLIKPFQWLFESMEGWPDFVRWIVVIALAIICVALIAHIVYTLASAIRGPIVRRRQSYAVARQEVDPSELERQADLSGTAGDYIGAIRLLFRAALRRIEMTEERKLRPGCTNRELLRRYRSTPLFEPLARFVELIDLKWYGGDVCDHSDYAACRGEYGRIRDHVLANSLAMAAPVRPASPAIS